MKASNYEELERVIDKFPKYYTKILLGYLCQVRGEDIFKPKTGIESLHEISNDNGVRRHLSILDVRGFRGADCGNDHYLVVAKVRDSLAVTKQTMHRVHMERFNLKKLNNGKG
ncbi:hypothetical protein B7P43_G13305 [Cryptotermes secundus]|uniref:Uncharacterized protein n=1 Tax=Cryptotermes secundus TaxID=105785 RepID=A0A2J7RKV2_9NEOP|nr:hypothetical protein B7P43_G13305 [Cryptotermes secundus]